MIRLTTTENSILDIIKQWQKEYFNSPQITDLASEIDKTREAVLQALYKLELKGFIQLVRRRRRIMIVPLYWK